MNSQGEEGSSDEESDEIDDFNDSIDESSDSENGEDSKSYKFLTKRQRKRMMKTGCATFLTLLIRRNP
jgi:hypothetical protein